MTQSAAIRHRVEAAIGVDRSLATRKWIDVRIRAPVIIDVTVRVSLIMTGYECAVVAVIWPHIMVPLRVCGDH